MRAAKKIDRANDLGPWPKDFDPRQPIKTKALGTLLKADPKAVEKKMQAAKGKRATSRKRG